MNSFIVVLVLFALTGTALGLRTRAEADYLGLKNIDTKRSIASKGDARIAGGELAPEAASPWLVSLENRFYNHFCAGNIIADQWVLTAASCVAGLQKSHIFVMTGSNNWWEMPWYYEIEEVHIHCNFDKPLYHNDIALLKTKTKFAYTEMTQKIATTFEHDLTKGERLTFTGWGNSGGAGEAYNPDLMKLQTSYMPYEECKAAYSNSPDVDFGHLCTSSPMGEGFCHGDAGGGLVNSKGELVGIANWGIPCGRGFPDVYASVAYHNDWIRSTINGCTIEP